MPESAVQDLIETCHEFDVQVSTGGFVESVLVRDNDRVEELEREGAIDPASAVAEAHRHLDAGAYKIMVESEGITERVREWRTDVAFEIADEVGVENCVFEAADPQVFEWYIKNFGPNVNLFVDNSQIVELECMRSGLWGKKSSWGRVASWTGE